MCFFSLDCLFFFLWSRGFGVLFGFWVGWFCFFNPNLVHLLEVCTMATFTIVFVGLQT